MQFEFNIFPKYFTTHDKQTDVNKDVNGKGTLERFNEVVGKSIDTEVKPLIDGLVDNIYPALTMQAKYVPYAESEMGFIQSVSLYLSNAIPTRRKVLQVITRLYDIRGTIRCYRICFSMIGLSMVLTEHQAGYGFDSPLTFDDVNRHFDSGCPTCSDYSLDLTGSLALTSQVLQAIASIIHFNEPINARLRSLTYNGQPIIVGIPDFNNDYNNDYLI